MHVVVKLTAVRFAGDMQKEVTVKRGEIDALQTKIHWLEECLDAALRVSGCQIVDRACLGCCCDGLADVSGCVLQDKKSLRERCEALSEAVERRQQEQARAARELKNSSSKCEGYRQQVSKLEAGLERVSQSVSQ